MKKTMDEQNGAFQLLWHPYPNDRNIFGITLGSWVHYPKENTDTVGVEM